MTAESFLILAAMMGGVGGLVAAIVVLFYRPDIPAPPPIERPLDADSLKKEIYRDRASKRD